jgi:hypothetical protein
MYRPNISKELSHNPTQKPKFSNYNKTQYGQWLQDSNVQNSIPAHWDIDNRLQQLVPIRIWHFLVLDLQSSFPL